MENGLIVMRMCYILFHQTNYSRPIRDNDKTQWRANEPTSFSFRKAGKWISRAKIII